MDRQWCHKEWSLGEDTEGPLQLFRGLSQEVFASDIINGQKCNFSIISWKTHDIRWLLDKCCHPVVCCYCNLSLRVGSSKAKLLSQCLCLLAGCSVLLRWSNAHPLANSDWHEIEVVFDWCRKFHMDVRRTFSITVFSRVGFKLLCLVHFPLWYWITFVIFCNAKRVQYF